MKIVPIIVVTLLLIGLTACDSDSSNRVLAPQLMTAQNLSDQHYVEYAQVSRRPGRGEASQKMRYQQFINQTAIMDYLLANEYQNDLALQLGLIDERNQLILKNHYQSQQTVTFSDQQVAEYYESNIVNYSEPYAQVGRLTMRISAIMNAEMRAQKMALIEQLHSDIKAQRITFEDAVAQYSNAKSSDLNSMYAASINLKRLGSFQHKVSVLSPGDVTEVLSDSAGLVVFQLQSAVKYIAKPLENVHAQIRYQLKQQHKKQQEQNIIASISAQKNIPTRQTPRGLLLVNENFGAGVRAAYAKLIGFAEGRETSLQQAFQAFSHRAVLADYFREKNSSIEQNLIVLIARNQYLEELHFKRIIESGVNDQSLAAHFEEQKKMFNRQYGEVAVISLNVARGAEDVVQEQIATLMQTISARIETGEITFVQAVEQYSQDAQSKQQQGSLGRVDINNLPGDPSEILQLTPGQISSVQTTEKGYRIYRLLDELQAAPMPFEEAKAEIKKLLTQKLIRQEHDRLSNVIKVG